MVRALENFGDHWSGLYFLILCNIFLEVCLLLVKKITVLIINYCCELKRFSLTRFRCLSFFLEFGIVDREEDQRRYERASGAAVVEVFATRRRSAI